MLTLKGLPTFDLDPGRARRIRERCHRALGRAGSGRRAGRVFEVVRSRVVESALVGGVSAVYLVEVLRRALQLYGW
jgi:hypothetical protein